MTLKRFNFKADTFQMVTQGIVDCRLMIVFQLLGDVYMKEPNLRLPVMLMLPFNQQSPIINHQYSIRPLSRFSSLRGPKAAKETLLSLKVSFAVSITSSILTRSKLVTNSS